ncbi:MAG: hypothetical protein PHQ08_00260 [Candidatus Pacebacteria bacterium]|jgi:hypothetical protein|nr:hypothetical protein [Candidatus Paceibacterota bacterium]
MQYQDIQYKYDKIYSYFRTTCEPFDFLDWDGKILKVWSNGIIIENYLYRDLEKNCFQLDTSKIKEV